MTRKLTAAASTVTLMAALALSACEHAHYFAGVSVGPPPPVSFGPLGVAPAPGWVWTDGFYTWGGNRWVWRPGRWVRPPHPGYVWRKPSYERYRNGYRMYPGRWVRH